MSEQINENISSDGILERGKILDTVLGEKVIDRLDIDEAYDEILAEIKSFIDANGDILGEEEKADLIRRTQEALDRDLMALDLELKDLDEEEKVRSINKMSVMNPEKTVDMRARELLDNLVETYKRPIEEAEAKRSYQEHPTEGISFREWTPEDVLGFSTFLSDNIFDKSSFEQMLSQHPLLWNPKGNPELYSQQQCVEVAVMFLIFYCYENHINLALPTGGKPRRLSDYPTVEDFMLDLYSNMAATHLFNEAQGLFQQVPISTARAGDIASVSHKNGEFHAYLLLSGFDATSRSARGISGNQANKQFRSDPGTREMVEKIYPKGFVKVQKNVSAENIQMRLGGYAMTPGYREKISLSQFEATGDKVKVLRVNPSGMNGVISRMVTKVV